MNADAYALNQFDWRQPFRNQRLLRSLLIQIKAKPTREQSGVGEAAMSKYDGLRDYLRLQKGPEFSLTFKDIEKAIGAALPKSAQRPQWWANVTDLKTTHVQRNAWHEAGFDAFLISGSDRVTFRKAGRFR